MPFKKEIKYCKEYIFSEIKIPVTFIFTICSAVSDVLMVQRRGTNQKGKNREKNNSFSQKK